MTTYIKEVIAVFEKHADPSTAIPMAKYMKNKFEYFGIKSPLRKEISRPFLVNSNLPHVQVVPEITIEFWERPERELQYFAMSLSQKNLKTSPIDHIELYENLILQKSWWDTVDSLATWNIGQHFRRFPQQISVYTNKWMSSKNIWLQRSCLLFQLKYKEKTDFKLLKSFILPLISSKEFFIKKAIGWALREYSKTNPEEVVRFVKEYSLSTLSYREATRLLK